MGFVLLNDTLVSENSTLTMLDFKSLVALFKEGFTQNLEIWYNSNIEEL